MYRLGRGMPTMLNTHLGWVLGANFTHPSPRNTTHSNLSVSTPSSVSLFVQSEQSDPLSEQVSKFWALEELPTKVPLPLEDEKVERLFCETSTRLEDGSF